LDIAVIPAQKSRDLLHRKAAHEAGPAVNRLAANMSEPARLRFGYQ
jgi:hypothetical protein